MNPSDKHDDEGATAIRQVVERLRSTRLVSDGLWQLLSQGGRALTSLATFLLLTRGLGVRDYGIFAGTLALTTALFPFSNFGAGHLLMQRVSRDEGRLPTAWGDALVASATGMVLTLLVIATIGPLLIPGLGVATLAMIAASQLLFVSIGQVVTFAYEARRRFWVSTVLTGSFGLARFLAVLLLYLRDGRLSLSTIAVALLATSVVHSIAAAALLTSVARPHVRLRSAWRSLLSGSNFMFGQFSAALQNDVDKTMLVSLGMPAAAGLYTAGYRVVSYSLLPVESLVFASYPRFFRRGGAGGIAETWRYARRLASTMALYGVGTSVVLMVLAGPIASVFGGGYAEAAEVIRVMAVLVVLQSVRNTLGNALTGANYQTYRTVIILIAAGGNIGLNLLLIPALSWRGAMIATYVTETFLLVASLLVIIHKRRVEFGERQGLVSPTRGVSEPGSGSQGG